MNSELKTLLCGSLLAASLLTPAQAKTGTLYFKSPASYQVLGVSQNGLWATGLYYNEDTEVAYGFRWNLETGKIEMTGDSRYGYQITNDGTMIGSVYTKSVGDGTKTVEAAATWQDGHWTPLEYPANSNGCWGYAISPDGHYVTGTSNNYVSYIWKDGQLTNTLEALGSSITYSISPDGQYAGGWVSPQGTRCAGYWSAVDNKFHYMEPEVWDEEDQQWEHKGSPWQAVKKFSADSQKFLYWGGYHIDPNHPELGYGIKAIYDFATQDTTYIYPTEEDPFNFDFYDMNDDATEVVGMQQDMEGEEHAIIWRSETGKTELLETYLNSLGCTFSDDDMMLNADGTHYIARGMSISGDGKTMAILYYDNQYEYHTMIVALDRNVDLTPAVNLEAKQVTGLSVAKLTWDEPLGDKSTLQSYNLYRNGTLLESLPVSTSSITYYDRDLANGEYSYCVEAVYEEGVAAARDTVSVTITTRQAAVPQDVFARQKGYNDAYVMWNVPASNLIPCTYLEGLDLDETEGFGGGTVSFESAIRFPADQMALYEGCRLTAVNFYPKSEQGSWLINIYNYDDEGKLNTLGSFKVNDDDIRYNELNTFYLPRQITLQTGKELVIGVQTNITTSSYDVQGVLESYYKKTYTDLIRQVGEDDFYSMNEASSGTYQLTWCISALFAPAGQTKDIDAIDHYNVYLDNAKQGESQTTAYQIPGIANGTHSVAVEAVYANDTISAQSTSSVTINADASALKPITPTALVNAGVANISWSAPIDDDARTMGYCGDVPGSHVPKTTDDVSEVLALAEFPASKLQGYEGYQIQSVSFYPMTDCGYVISIYRDEEEVAVIEPGWDLNCNAWNTCQLDQPVTIEANTIYRLVIDCYDSPSGANPLGTDDTDTNEYGSLYQVPGDEGWYSITEFGSAGNWMMYFNIADPAGSTFAIDNYTIYIDGAQASTQAETAYAYTLPDNNQHTVRVDAHYVIADRNVTGTEVTFGAASAISTVHADVTTPAIYTLDGIRHKAPVHGFNIISHHIVNY